jgi:hypothetical protein
MSKAIRQPRRDRINGNKGDNGNGLSSPISGQRSWRANRNNDVDTTLMHHLVRQRQECINISPGVSKLNSNIAPFYIAEFAQQSAGSISL